MAGDELSRRLFLGASGAGVALGLVPRSLAGAMPANPPAPRQRLVVDAVVVGAGLSGLVAARRLVKAGFSVVVLEARDQIGGPSPDVTRLTGAHTRVLELAREVRLPIRRVDAGGKTVERANGTRFVVPTGWYSADPRVDTEVRSALQRLNGLASETNPAEPWRAANAAIRDASTLQQWLDTHVPSTPARRRLATLLEAVWGAHPSELSLLHALTVGASADGISGLIDAATAPTATVDGGVDALRARLAASLGHAVHTGTRARSITQDTNGAVVATDASDVRARRGVVVAIPVAATLGIEFVPTLPSARTLLAQRMPRGSTAVVVCRYATAFWAHEGLSGRAVADDSLVGTATPLASGWAQRPSLVARLSGSHASEWASLPATQRRTTALDALRGWFGERAGRPLTYDEVQSIGPPRLARTSASLAPPGVLSAWGPALRTPVGLVTWAGSEPATTWAGFPEGSVEAGERAAAELVAIGTGGRTNRGRAWSR